MISAAALLLAISAPHARDCFAAPDTALRYVLLPAGTTVSFTARASLGSFRGTTSTVRGWVELADTAQLEGSRGEVEVELATLRTGIGLRDGDTRGALETDRFPVATFTLLEIVPAQSDSTQPQSDSTPRPPEASLAAAELHQTDRRVTVTGDLTLHGQTRRTSFAASYRFAGDTLWVSGETEVLLSDFGITKRKRFLGILSVNDRTGLAFEALFALERGEGRANPATPVSWFDSGGGPARLSPSQDSQNSGEATACSSHSLDSERDRKDAVRPSQSRGPGSGDGDAGPPRQAPGSENHGEGCLPTQGWHQAQKRRGALPSLGAR